MIYKYAKQKDVTELNKWCLEIIHAVQNDLRDFDIRLIDSGEKRTTFLQTTTAMF